MKARHNAVNNLVSLFKPTITRILLFSFASFTLMAWLCLPNLHHDMFESYAWGQTLEWGSFKHPPFFSWITRCWFTLFPTNALAYYALSYLNSTIALLGILCLSNLLVQIGSVKKLNHLQMRTFLLLVLIFSLLSWPYTAYAFRFNADTILLSIWPWTAYAFFACLEAENKTKKSLWSIALAILAAASLLSKYFSGVLLLALVIISLLDKRYRRWYVTPQPYVCFAIFVLLISPHLWWEYQMDFPFGSYISRYSDPTSFFQIFSFSMSGIYYFFASWLLWFTLRRCFVDSVVTTKISLSNLRYILSLCFLPMMIAIFIAYMSTSSLKERWAIPIWFAMPILMAYLLVNKLDAISVRIKSLIVAVGFFWLIVFVFILGAVLFVPFFKGGTDHRANFYEARKEMAIAIAHRFNNKYPGKTLGWVGGRSWPEHPPALAFYMTNHPRAIPGFPDQVPALINPHKTWSTEHGVIICGKDINPHTYRINDCIKETRLWLQSKQLPIDEERIAYHASGWRYPKSIEKEIVVFWLLPSTAHG